METMDSSTRAGGRGLRCLEEHLVGALGEQSSFHFESSRFYASLILFPGHLMKYSESKTEFEPASLL